MKYAGRRTAVRQRFVRTVVDGRSDLYGRRCNLCKGSIEANDEVLYQPMADMPKFADPAMPVMHGECADELSQVEDPNVERSYRKTRRKLEPTS